MEMSNAAVDQQRQRAHRATQKRPHYKAAFGEKITKGVIPEHPGIFSVRIEVDLGLCQTEVLYTKLLLVYTDFSLKNNDNPIRQEQESVSRSRDGFKPNRAFPIALRSLIGLLILLSLRRLADLAGAKAGQAAVSTRKYDYHPSVSSDEGIPPIIPRSG